MGWITIKTYNFGHEATIAQHLLENEGIETHLMDDLSIQVNPLYSNALGGVKLQVWEDDVERAMQLMAENNLGVSRIASQNYPTEDKAEQNRQLVKLAVIVALSLVFIAGIITIMILRI